MDLGYHVYCEKPLSHSVYEARIMAETARKKGLMTQLGNQGHSMEDVRRLVEWIADGAIGQVREVIAWCDRPRPSTYMISGLTRPVDTPPVPDDLDWDLWIGPAPFRPYHPLYHPGKWRGWVDFGCGAIGDMGCHILDPAFWSLNLGAPSTVEASTTTIDKEINRESYPHASIIRWEFPARGSMPPVVMSWYDGGLLPKLPPGIGSLEELGSNGAMLIGEKGTIVYGMHGAQGLRILPDESMQAYREPPKTIPRVSGHHSDWVEACKTGKPASANWDHGGPLTEMVLLGGIAVRMKDRKLFWDPENLRFTNSEDACRMVRREYREGWSL
jgi:predicted dehydrogenase